MLLHSKNFFGHRDGKILRSVMGKCDLPVADQLFVQFGPKFVHIEPKVGLKQLNFVHSEPKFDLKIGKSHFPVTNLNIFPSAPKKFFLVYGDEAIKNTF